MAFSSEPTFDIRNFAHQLTQAKKGRYNCPNCGKPKLSIDRHSGKYQCWNCYDTKAIAKRCCEAQIAFILTAPEREERRRQEESVRLANSFSPQQREAEWITGSGVAPEITAKNIRHIDHAPAIAQLLNWNWYSHTGGWYVSSCDPKTGMRGKSGQFKPDTAIQFPDHDEPQKYLSFPKGGKSDAVCLVVTLDFWHKISEQFGVPLEDADIIHDREDLGFWLWVLNHPELPIVLTEGAKKAACLLSHGWIAISISGVWMGQEGKGTKLHPSIRSFIVPGRPVYLAFDSDIIIKESVEAALRQLGRLIKKERAEVFICLWHFDQGKGVDDLIVAEGARAFEQAFDEALPYSQWLKSLQPDNNSGNGSGAFRGRGDSGDSNDTAKERGAAVALLEKEQPLQEDNIEFLQKALNFLYGDKHWISVEGKLYCWTGKYYQYRKDVLELRRICKFCNSYPVVTKQGVRFPYANPAKVYETLNWIKLNLAVDEDSVNPPGINCTNGVLQLEWSVVEFNPIPTWRLVPHTPDFYYIYEPIVTYDPDADSSSCDRLLEALDAPQRDIFLKTIAASLDLPTIRKYKGRMVRALLLKGHGSNGKDTLREAVAAMYGYQGMTNKTLSDYAAYDNGRKFPLAPLKYSRVNWASENANTTRLDKIQSLKAFITGDPLDSERKGKDEDPFKPKGIALFNVNDTPNLRGTLEAIAGRYGILSFMKTFKIGADPSSGEIEADPRFKDDPEFLRTQVLPAFLNRVLDALQRLMTEGIDYGCTQKAMEDIQAENSHLFQFCQDTGLGYDPNARATAGEIWERLEQWYQDNGTLTYEESANGKQKAIWVEQAFPGDRNVKGANQIIPRFQQLFPKAKRITVGKGKMALFGISFAPTPTGGGEPVELTGEAIVSQSVSLNPLSDKSGEPVTPVPKSEEVVDCVVCSGSQLNPDFESVQLVSTAEQLEQLPRLPHHPCAATDVASPTSSPTDSSEVLSASPFPRTERYEMKGQLGLWALQVTFTSMTKANVTYTSPTEESKQYEQSLTVNCLTEIGQHCVAGVTYLEQQILQQRVCVQEATTLGLSQSEQYAQVCWEGSRFDGAFGKVVRRSKDEVELLIEGCDYTPCFPVQRVRFHQHL